MNKECKEKKTSMMIGKFTRTPSGITAYKIETIDEKEQTQKPA